MARKKASNRFDNMPFERLVIIPWASGMACKEDFMSSLLPDDDSELVGLGLIDASVSEKVP